MSGRAWPTTGGDGRRLMAGLDLQELSYSSDVPHRVDIWRAPITESFTGGMLYMLLGNEDGSICPALEKYNLLAMHLYNQRVDTNADITFGVIKRKGANIKFITVGRDHYRESGGTIHYKRG